MFTGIILGQGKILSQEKYANETRLKIQALFDLPNIIIGESIAVNGVCLTVETKADNIFTAYASAETMKRTNLGNLTIGSNANLERALAVGDRFGGHIVSGHVDTVAKVEFVRDAGLSKLIRLSYDKAYASEIIGKGSVCLDGISLTVNHCEEDFLEVNVIPETWKVTTIANWVQASEVNLETDIIGKYVKHLLNPYAQKESKIDLKLLSENGFL